jgi:orotate phosphoribosyltransferase
MSEIEQALLQLLKERSFRSGQPGQFRLASGATSRYYVDGKMCELFSRSAFLIGEVLYERTKDLGIDAIGGLEIGAIPMTTAAVISYQLKGQEMEGFWVRNWPKAHGTKKLIEGRLEPGMRVAIVDDVITKGGSALKAVEEVQRMGCEVAIVLALVDRLGGAEALFKESGVTNYAPIFTIRDFGCESDVPETVHAAAH